MITKNCTNENVTDATIITFGSGDIRMDKVEYADGSVGLAFAQGQPGEIGRETSEHIGKTLKDLNDVAVVMEFDKPESISALIHSLVEIQKTLFLNEP